jgi:hypothetical protein
LKRNPATEQLAIISNGVEEVKREREFGGIKTGTTFKDDNGSANLRKKCVSDWEVMGRDASVKRRKEEQKCYS